jgi:hypothetical protein
VLQLYVMATSFYTQIVVDNDREATPALLRRAIPVRSRQSP